MDIKSILVPIDFSACSKGAFESAVAWGKHFGATVHVLHAYHIPPVVLPDGGFAISQELSAKIAAASQTALRAYLAQVASAGVTLKAHVHQTEPAASILEVASEVDADLIVMGTHGRSGMSRALLGSVAEKILRSSPVPVLIVPGLHKAD